MVKMYMTAAFLVLLSSFCLQAQGRGGGIYAEDGAEIAGTVIHSNQGSDGYGVAGGNVVLVNGVVAGNGEIVRTSPTQSPGSIYCADGSVVDTATYKTRSEKDAIGVVFWVNPDPYVRWPRGYVIALREGKKTLDVTTVLPELRFDMLMDDTNSYRKTVAMAQAGSEAATWCREYAALPDLSDRGKWAAPAGRHLSMLLNTYGTVMGTLDFLERIPEHAGTVVQMQSGPYGSITQMETYVDFWSWQQLAPPPDEPNYMSASFVAEIDSSSQEYWFRPVFVY